MMNKANVFLSLGSNSDNPVSQVKRAIQMLQAHSDWTLCHVSPLYRTSPEDYLEQPDFINCTLGLETALEPIPLLKALQGVENRIGKEKSILKGPRRIDIDILFYEDAIVNTPELQIPHPRMQQRRFVLKPLADIYPLTKHAPSGLTVQELLSRLPLTNQNKVVPL